MGASVVEQRGFPVRFGWGAEDLAVLTPVSDAVVIVDVLSFTSAVSVAVGRGARVWPYRFRDASAAAFAASLGVQLAAPRTAASSPGRWTISPAGLAEIPAGTRFVLPSPNGSALSAAAAVHPSVTVVAGCLRNAAAVGGWLAGLVTANAANAGRTVAVIAAGERWPDAAGRPHAGPLRPAIEDLLGAGAVLARTVERAALSPRRHLSPEARAALAAFRAAAEADPTCDAAVGETCSADAHAVSADAASSSGGAGLLADLRESVSGRELAAGGWGADVVAAADLDADDVVPVLTDGAYDRLPEWTTN